MTDYAGGMQALPGGICGVEDCDLTIHGRFPYCQMHYTRWKRHGDPTFRKVLKGANPIERFRSKLVQGPIAKNRPDLGHCEDWTGARTDFGYGQFWYKPKGEPGRLWVSHMWAYRFILGLEVPEGKQLDHFACDRGNEGCSNGYHVQPVSPRENVLRSTSFSALNAVKTHCPYDHPYDDDNTYVTSRGYRQCKECHREREAQRQREMRRSQGIPIRSEMETRQQLARDLGISRATLYRMAKRGVNLDSLRRKPQEEE